MLGQRLARTEPPRVRQPESFLIVFLFLLSFRLCNALIIDTYFDPDEYWQSLEVAYSFVFGRGHLTWEWDKQIRGFGHPLVFACVYWTLKLLGLDRTRLIVLAPKFVQAVFASVGDYFSFLLSLRLFGPSAARWTLFSLVCSWFNFYCLVRTYSNSMEASLTSVALYYWPWDDIGHRSRFRTSLVLAAAACIIRPTNALVWIFLGLGLMTRFKHRVFAILVDVLVVAKLAIFVSMYIDFIFYRKWLFTPLNFFRVNVAENISLYYGGHPFHFYFTQAIPLVLLTFLPLVALGVYLAPQKRTLFSMALFVVLCLSCLGHKEFRFLMPLVSPMLIYAGHALARISRYETNRYYNAGIAFLVASNVLLALYLGTVHKQGVVKVTDWLRNEAANHRVQSVLFLMPCHSTPYYSRIVHDIPMRFITCEPPLGME